jgi:hypothetical protein
MAERDGVAADTLRAIVAGDTRMMPDEAVLAYRFAKASLARDAAADELRIEINAGDSGASSRLLLRSRVRASSRP